MRPAPLARRGFFPLDEELKLVPGEFTPSIVESIVRLGTWMPFVPVTEGLAYFCKVNLSEATARRKTEQAGHAYVAVQTAQVEAIARDESPPSVGPAVQQLSADGAMVPLLHKAWGEVKTVAIGVVGPPVLNPRTGEPEVHASEISYFSRMTDHETFSRLATVETHRRGTATAGMVCAVNDGADWEQQFVGDQRPNAVRILDWGHGTEHLAEVGRVMFGSGTAAEDTGRHAQFTELKTGDPDRVLLELRQLRDGLAAGTRAGVEAEAIKVVTDNLGYLAKRREQIQYAAFEQAGFPIGSGMVESGNKLVVEARLKGAGMHWAPEHVDPMVALRTVACTDRWEEAWPQIVAQWRADSRARSAMRRAKRLATAQPTPTAPASTPPAIARFCRPEDPLAVPTSTTPPDTITKSPRVAHRPAANHPWRRQHFGKASQQQLAS